MLIDKKRKKDVVSTYRALMEPLERLELITLRKRGGKTIGVVDGLLERLVAAAVPC